MLALPIIPKKWNSGCRESKGDTSELHYLLMVANKKNKIYKIRIFGGKPRKPRKKGKSVSDFQHLGQRARQQATRFLGPGHFFGFLELLHLPSFRMLYLVPHDKNALLIFTLSFVVRSILRLVRGAS